jgi:hypothetical protein
VAYQVGQELLKMKKKQVEKGVKSSSILSDNSAALVERFNYAQEQEQEEREEEAKKREEEAKKREEKEKRKYKQCQNERSSSLRYS